MRRYKGYLKDNPAGVIDLIQVIRAAASRNRAVCLTCFERDVHECHRSILVSAVKKTLKGLSSIVSQLKTERTNLANQLRHVDAALSVLGKPDGGSNHTKPRRTLSASARKRISLAQKARWARAASGKAATKKPKATMSAAGKKRIAAAQRARWGKGKAAK